MTYVEIQVKPDVKTTMRYRCESAAQEGAVIVMANAVLFPGNPNEPVPILIWAMAPGTWATIRTGRSD